MGVSEAPQWLLPTWIRTCGEAGATVATSSIEATGVELLNRWQEPHRSYHGVRHLVEVLTRVDELVEETHAPALVRLAAWFHGAFFRTENPDDLTETSQPKHGSMPRESAVASNCMDPTTVLDTTDLKDAPPGRLTPRSEFWCAESAHPLKSRIRSGEDLRASAQIARVELSELGLPEAKVVRVCSLITDLRAHCPTPGDFDSAALCDADLAVLACEPQKYQRYLKELREEYDDIPLLDYLQARLCVVSRLLSRRVLFVSPNGRVWEEPARQNLQFELHRLAHELKKHGVAVPIKAIEAASGTDHDADDDDFFPSLK